MFDRTRSLRVAPLVFVTSLVLVCGPFAAYAEGGEGDVSVNGPRFPTRSVENYDARDVFGINWDGWHVTIVNSTGADLSNETCRAFYCPALIHSGETDDTTRGSQGWFFGYYPYALLATFSSPAKGARKRFVRVAGGGSGRLAVQTVRCGYVQQYDPEAPLEYVDYLMGSDNPVTGAGCTIMPSKRDEPVHIMFS